MSRKREIWKICADCPDYKISTSGKIKCLKNIRKRRIGDLIEPYIAKCTSYYPTVALCGKTKLYVHRLVAKTFLGEPNGLHVNHKDGNKLNNNVSNLEYCTRSENAIHAYRTGLKSTKGENNGRCVLTKAQAIEIKKLLKLGLICKEISKQLNIPIGRVSSIKCGKCWKWLDYEL